MKKLLLFSMLLIAATMLHSSDRNNKSVPADIVTMAKGLPAKEQQLIRIIVKNDRVINCKIDVLNDIASK